MLRIDQNTPPRPDTYGYTTSPVNFVWHTHHVPRGYGLLAFGARAVFVGHFELGEGEEWVI